MHQPEINGSLEGIIFDNDGVLSCTAPRQYQWFQNWAMVNGKPPLPYKDLSEFLLDYNYTLHGAGDVASGVQNFYDKHGLPCDMKDKDHPVWAAYNEFKTTHQLGLFPGIKEVLEQLYALGSLSAQRLTGSTRLRMAVNSTNTWETISRELERAGVIQYFDTQVGIEILREAHGAGNGESLRKPSTISVAWCLRTLGTTGPNTMHVGDTRADLAASREVLVPGLSKKVDLLMVGAAWGYEGRELLERGTTLESGKKVNFDYIIDKPEELVPIVKHHRGL